MKTPVKEIFKKDKPITIVTAYDFPSARIVESADIDAILVGDSLGNVVLGYDSTLEVTMEDMLHHVKAVSRGVDKTPIIADMPFLSYQVSLEESIRNAGELMRAGAGAVKLEGGKRIIKSVRKMVDAGIPVMGHLGLTPQSIFQLGGYKVQGRDENEREKLLENAKRLEKAGVFSIVLECVPQELTEEITANCSIPIIGIGAGPHCDGQVLVFNDLLGYSINSPEYKFVRKYAELSTNAVEGLRNFKRDVENGVFPDHEHSFSLTTLKED